MNPIWVPDVRNQHPREPGARLKAATQPENNLFCHPARLPMAPSLLPASASDPSRHARWSCRFASLIPLAASARGQPPGIKLLRAWSAEAKCQVAAYQVCSPFATREDRCMPETVSDLQLQGGGWK